MNRRSDANWNQSRRDIPSDQTQDGRQGEGGANSAVKDRQVSGNGQGTQVVRALNEASIKEALIAGRGDLWTASQMLGITALKLDRAIRLSEDLQNVFLSLKQVRALPDYDRLSTSQIEAEVASRLVHYRSDALDALHALATMPIDENSAQNQVKLLAASRLSGPMEGHTGGELDQTLHILNEEYQQKAPRIKSIRERIVTFESGPIEPSSDSL